MSVKRRHTTQDERGYSNHYKEPHRFEFSGHDSVLDNHMQFWLTIFMSNFGKGLEDYAFPCTPVIKLESIDRKGLHRGKTYRSL